MRLESLVQSFFLLDPYPKYKNDSKLVFEEFSYQPRFILSFLESLS